MDAELEYKDPDWVAEKLGLDKTTVYRFLNDGSLPGVQLGRKWLISPLRLAEFLRRNEREQTERRRATAWVSQSFAHYCEVLVIAQSLAKSAKADAKSQEYDGALVLLHDDVEEIEARLTARLLQLSAAWGVDVFIQNARCRLDRCAECSDLVPPVIRYSPLHPELGVPDHRDVRRAWHDWCDPGRKPEDEQEEQMALQYE